MIELTIFTSAGRKTVLVDPNKKVKDVLTEQGVNYGSATLQLDGAAVQVGQLEKTFSEIGITERCAISAIIKTSNAGR